MQHIHEAAPRFKARWSTGPLLTAQDSADFWIDEATDEDNIQIFNFNWNDGPPDHGEFEDLMNQAASVIDE